MATAVSVSRGSTPAQPRRFDGLRLIAVFKFMKAILLVATTYGVHKLLDPALLERLNIWLQTSLSDDRLARKLLLQALDWVAGLGTKKIELVIGVTMVYTAVVLTEGTGLWLRRPWAEWLTVVFTGSLIPFELWELITRPPGHKLTILATFALNVIIVWYLARLLRHAHKQRHAEGA